MNCFLGNWIDAEPMENLNGANEKPTINFIKLIERQPEEKKGQAL